LVRAASAPALESQLSHTPSQLRLLQKVDDFDRVLAIEMFLAELLQIAEGTDLAV
jgi:hypothetical protein